MEDFTKQYNRQKTIIQNSAAGIPTAQGPKRNPQSAAAAVDVAPAAYTSRKAGEYDDSLDSLSRYAGRIKLKDDSKYVLKHLPFHTHEMVGCGS